MISNAADALQATLEALDDYGLLLLSDAKLPSMVGRIVGEPIHTSWWGHPLGGVIYGALTVLEDHPDVLSTKLIAGKVTYVHRRLWQALIAVGISREDWQVSALSQGERWLLGQVDAEGEVQTYDLVLPSGVQRKRLPELARGLERRILLNAAEIHTPTGAHAKVLETWQHWVSRVEFSEQTIESLDGKRQLEDAAGRLTGMTGGRAKLPW